MASGSYRESPAPASLADVVTCTWRRWSDRGDHFDVLPDGCVDIIWSNDRGLFVAGPDRGPTTQLATQPTEFVGVRFRPGVAATVLGVPAFELRDQRVGLDDVWGRAAHDLAEQVFLTSSPAEQTSVLESAIAGRLADADVDSAVLAAADLVAAGELSIGGLADHVGLSDRQLLRRFNAQVGYPPKVFDRIMRFRRFLDAGQDVTTGSLTLAGAAAGAGYADQAHLTRECRRLAGRTPAELVARMFKTTDGAPVTMAA